MMINYSVFDGIKLLFPIFFPRSDTSPPPPGAEDHLIPVEPGISLAARHYISPSSFGTILYFHGNGEVVADHDGIAGFYHGVGLDLFVVDYRGYGGSGGRPSIASLVSDAHPIAARFHAILDERGARGPRFIMGRSLGAHPALEVAVNRPEGFRGLILESAAASLHRLMARFADPPAMGALDEVITAHNAKIAKNKLPTLFLHGEQDELIPLSHAEDIRALMTAADTSLVVIKKAGHNDILFRGLEIYFDSIRDFVRR